MSFEVIIPFLRPIKHLLEADTVSEIMLNPMQPFGELTFGICFAFWFSLETCVVSSP